MNSASQRWPDAGNGSEFCFRGVFNALSSAEMTQERLQFFGSETLYCFKGISQPRTAASLTMEAVHEPMRLITSVDEHPATSVQHQWFVFGSKDGLLALGKGGEREAIFPSVFFQCLTNGVEMGFSTVDEQQIGLFRNQCEQLRIADVPRHGRRGLFDRRTGGFCRCVGRG